MPEAPMDSDLTHQLKRVVRDFLTFCLALALMRVDLVITFAAVSFLVSKLVNSNTWAKPPYKKFSKESYYLPEKPALKVLPKAGLPGFLVDNLLFDKSILRLLIARLLLLLLHLLRGDLD
jgi:hypothetical protein